MPERPTFTGMAQNDNHVTTAERFLESALSAQLHLQEQYDLPKHHQDPTRIAALHQAINYGMKAAEVSALIGIGQQLRDLNEVDFEEHAAAALRIAERLDEATVTSLHREKQ